MGGDSDHVTWILAPDWSRVEMYLGRVKYPLSVDNINHQRISDEYLNSVDLL